MTDNLIEALLGTWRDGANRWLQPCFDPPGYPGITCTFTGSNAPRFDAIRVRQVTMGLEALDKIVRGHYCAA